MPGLQSPPWLCDPDPVYRLKNPSQSHVKIFRNGFWQVYQCGHGGLCHHSSCVSIDYEIAQIGFAIINSHLTRDLRKEFIGKTFLHLVEVVFRIK